jgi:drug/metabolite transporter, DME family
MEPITLALISAVLFGLNMVVIKVAISKKPFPLNALITFAVSSVILWAFVLVLRAPFPSRDALPFFIAAGALAPGLSAILNFESFRRAGVSITSSLIATSPFFSMILAVIFLRETINILIGFGTLMLVAGVAVISWFRPKGHVKPVDLLFPIFAAVSIGSAAVVSKIGLNISNVPLSGIAIAVTAGVVLQMVFITGMRKWHTISRSIDEMKYFALGGVFIGFALLALFSALASGEVVVVFPLSNTQTLFAIFFSWIFLRKLDHITMHTVLGAVAVVIGAALISLGA